METNEATDQELMNRFKAGDHAAFSQLIHRWDGRIAKLLSRLVPQNSDVEDLRQEAFLRVLLHRQNYQSTFAFSTWMYRIAINLARDHSKRKRLGFLFLNGHRLVDKKSTPHVNCSDQEVSELMAESLDSLPHRFREVLVMKYLSQLSYSEIGEILRQPISTVKSRTHAALKRLKIELEKKGVCEVEIEHEMR